MNSIKQFSLDQVAKFMLKKRQKYLDNWAPYKLPFTGLLDLLQHKVFLSYTLLQSLASLNIASFVSAKIEGRRIKHFDTTVTEVMFSHRHQRCYRSAIDRTDRHLCTASGPDDLVSGQTIDNLLTICLQKHSWASHIPACICSHLSGQNQRILHVVRNNSGTAWHLAYGGNILDL